MSENVILKLYDSLINQLSSIDKNVCHRLEQIEDELRDFSDRVKDLEQAQSKTKELKDELRKDLKEIRKQWKSYKKYFYLCALGTVITASATFGYEKVLMFLKTVFKIM